MALMAIACVTAAFPFPATGAPAATAEAPKEDFRVSRERIEMPEQPDAIAVVVITGRRKFTFLPPAMDWAQQSDPKEKTIGFTARDLSGSLELRILPTAVDLKSCRGRIAQKFPEARVTSEFACHTAEESGQAFDFERPAAKGAKLLGRLAYVPFKGGTIEVQMTATPKQFRRAHFMFARVMSSLTVVDLPPPAAAAPPPKGRL